MDDQVKPDISVLACNYLEGTPKCSTGTLAYVLRTSEYLPGGRVGVLARSRSGRWIETVENVNRLHNFRVKTIPSENPRYGRIRAWDEAEILLAHIERWFHQRNARTLGLGIS